MFQTSNSREALQFSQMEIEQLIYKETNSLAGRDPYHV